MAASAVEEYPAHYRGVQALVEGGAETVPEIYVRPRDEEEYPVIDSPDLQIPLIDLASLDGPERSAVVRAVGDACRDWGFFLVKNHGISKAVMEAEMRAGRDFFALPTEQKMKYFDADPKSRMRYGTSFNLAQDKVLNWRDFLRYSCKPLDEMWHLWPEEPADFRRANAEYISEMGALARRLLGAISESLGLDREFMNKAFGADEAHSQVMAYNLYPACPDPAKTLGLPPHSDPGALTLLMQDEVPGLQVLHGEGWVQIPCVEDALVINVGDQVQLLSNDAYTSVLHRVVVDGFRNRMTVSTAYGPAWDAVVAPAPQLVSRESPPWYSSCVYGQFMNALQNSSLHKKSVLSTLRISKRL